MLHSSVDIMNLLRLVMPSPQLTLAFKTPLAQTIQSSLRRLTDD